MSRIQPKLETSLPHAVVRAFRLVNRAYNRALDPSGVSAEQAHLLSILWAVGPTTIARLQGLLALSSPTLSGAVDRMERQRLVRRVRSADDGRARMIEPDARANRWRRKIEATLADTELRCFGVLTVGERRELVRLLAKCAAVLDAEGS